MPDNVSMLTPFITSLAFVTLNEMGDKTQLLAMAMAARFTFWKVMLGVLIATLLNHGLAVAVGAALANIPGWSGWVRFIAAVLFIVFGLWALKPDKMDDSGQSGGKRRLGDAATVAAAFFLAEMGDKTQLATITLAARYSYAPLIVLAGTTSGMLVADSIGIVAGVLLHRRLPDRALKLFAAGAFVVFGLAGLWDACRTTLGLTAGISAASVAAAAAASLSLGVLIYKKENPPAGKAAPASESRISRTY
jgi:putative Ca2+/H+ antiporter (TMEM165/GDT1 family)